MVTLKEDTMSAAIKAVLATILTVVLIVVLALVEVAYTHGAITVSLMAVCVLGAIGLLFYAIFDCQ